MVLNKTTKESAAKILDNNNIMTNNYTNVKSLVHTQFEFTEPDLDDNTLIEDPCIEGVENISGKPLFTYHIHENTLPEKPFTHLENEYIYALHTIKLSLKRNNFNSMQTVYEKQILKMIIFVTSVSDLFFYFLECVEQNDSKLVAPFPVDSDMSHVYKFLYLVYKEVPSRKTKFQTERGDSKFVAPFSVGYDSNAFRVSENLWMAMHEKVPLKKTKLKFLMEQDDVNSDILLEFDWMATLKEVPSTIQQLNLSSLQIIPSEPDLFFLYKKTFNSIYVGYYSKLIDFQINLHNEIRININEKISDPSLEYYFLEEFCGDKHDRNEDASAASEISYIFEPDDNDRSVQSIFPDTQHSSDATQSDQYKDDYNESLKRSYEQMDTNSNEQILTNSNEQIQTNSDEQIQTNSNEQMDSNCNSNSPQCLIQTALEQYRARNFSMMERVLVESPEQTSDVTFGIGLACYEQKKYEWAAKCFEEAEENQRQCYRVTSDSQHLYNISLCRYYIAEIDIDQGYHKLAIDHLKESINAHQPQAQNACTQPRLNFQQLYELPHITLSAKLAKLALALRCINHIADSEDCYRKALKCSDITMADEISTHSSFGNLLHSVGDNERAVLEYKLAIEKAEKAIELATRDMTEADILQQKSFDGEDNGSAAKAFEEASQRLTDAQLSLTWAHGNLGNAYLSLGKYEKSLNHLQTSHDLTIKHEPSPSALSRALNNLGTVYQNMSKLDEAETHYDEALAQALYCDDRAAQARAFGNIGNLYMIKKNYQKAIPHYTEVLRLCKDRSTVYVAYHNRGCSFFELAEKRKSEQLSTWKRDEYQFVAFGFAARDVENKNQIRELEDNILHLYQQAQKDYNKVIKNLETAFSSISASPKGLDLYVSLFESNSKTFTRAQDCAYNLGDHHMALVYAEQARARTLGELLLKRTGTPLKSPLSIDSINSIMRQMKPHIPVVVLSYTGTRLLVWVLVFDGFKVLMSGFEQEPSNELFEGKSLDMYLRYRLGEDLTNNIDIYKEEKDTATNDLSHPSSNPPDICYSNNEMEEIGHSYANQALEETAQFAESQKEEKGDEEKADKEKDWTSQVDNSVINEEATPISAASANPSIYRATPTAKSKANILSSFNKYVGIPLQYTLKSLLVSAPSEASTAKIILVPDSSTKMIPFTALNDGEECFGDKFAIQYSPSLLAMGVLNQVPSTVINISNNRNVLIVGDPQTPPFKFKGDDWMLGELPFARKEAQWIGHYTNTIPLLGKDPTKDIVISRLRQAKLIHLAAHGSATHSFIALAGHQIQSMFNTYVVQDANSLLLYANDVLSLQLQPSLVILSSCDSGKGIFKGDDIQGLSRAFLLAGAQAVMTAIWKVPDESASFFMQFFYRYLLDGYTSTLALHKSIISIRCFLMFSQYIHWGGYQLTGNDVTLQVASAEDDDHIQTLLGRPSGCSPFPRLDYILDLEKNLLSNRDDSNVQVIRGPNNVEICEPVIDFIIKHYSCYRAIIWINSINVNCLLDRAEKKELMSPSLIVIDNATLECLSKLKPLRNTKECHLILLVRSMILEDEDISREIHRVLLRGVDILPYVLPLTQLQVTQRLVYNVLKDNQFSPNNHDQHNFQSLATMCRGSEVLVCLTQALLAQNIKKSNGDVQYCLDLLKNEIEDTYDNNFHDVLHEDWTASIDNVSRSTLTLLKSFAISPASQYLLNCLSVLAGTPIPSSFLLSLESEIEAKVTDVSEVSPIKELKQMNCLVQYPSTVILHGTTDNDVNNSLYYIPVIIGDSIWDYALTDTDQVVAISTLVKIINKQLLHNLADHRQYMHQMLELILYKYNVLIKPHTSTSEDTALDNTTSDISTLEDSTLDITLEDTTIEDTTIEDSTSSVDITMMTSEDICLIDIVALKEILSAFLKLVKLLYTGRDMTRKTYSDSKSDGQTNEGRDYMKLKSLLEEFIEGGCRDYDEEFDDILTDISKTGVVRMPWKLLKPALTFKLDKCLNEVYDCPETNDDTHKQLVGLLERFDGPPFTIQRFCELLLDPLKHYKKRDSFMRALEKNLLVVSTQEPDLVWMKIPKLSQLLEVKSKVDKTSLPSNPDVILDKEPVMNPLMVETANSPVNSPWKVPRSPLSPRSRTPPPDLDSMNITRTNWEGLLETHLSRDPFLSRKRTASHRGSNQDDAVELKEADSTVSDQPQNLHESKKSYMETADDDTDIITALLGSFESKKSTEKPADNLVNVQSPDDHVTRLNESCDDHVTGMDESCDDHVTGLSESSDDHHMTDQHSPITSHCNPEEAMEVT